MGCFAKGCMLLVVAGVLMAAAFVAGSYYTWNKILPRHSIQLPPPKLSDEQAQAVRQRWNEFIKAADMRQFLRAEFTADELNALIAGDDPRWKDRIHIAIQDNVAQVRISIPLEQMDWMKGHYVNAEGRVQPSSDRLASGARVTSVVVNGQAMPEDVVNWQFFRWSLHDQIADWCERYRIQVFDIRDNKVILETRAD